MQKPTLQVVTSPAAVALASPYPARVQTAYTQWARYLFASQYVAGASVLDLGCGDGFGADLLAETAREVTGVDRDDASLQRARRQFAARTNLSFARHAVSEFVKDARSASFDVVTAFDVLEYLGEEEQASLWEALARLVKPGGVVLVSTTGPEAEALQAPDLVRPVSRLELERVARRHFGHVKAYEQVTFSGSGVFGTEPGALAARYLDWAHLVDLRARMRANLEPSSVAPVLVVSHEPQAEPRTGLAVIDPARRLLAEQRADLQQELAHLRRELGRFEHHDAGEETTQKLAALGAAVDVLSTRLAGARSAQTSLRQVESENRRLRRELETERLRMNHLENMLAVKVAMMMKSSLDRVPFLREAMRRTLLKVVG